MATPAFARIRSFFIDAEIVCGLKAGHEGILAGSKSFDRFLTLTKGRGLRGVYRQAGSLRQEKFDAAVLFPNSVSSALVCLLAGIPRRIGYRQGRGPLITHGISFQGERKAFWRRRGPRRAPVPMIDYYATLLDSLGMPRIGSHPILRVTREEELRCVETLAAHGIDPSHRLVLLAPTASFGPSKLWDNARWAETARAIVREARPPVSVLILCGPGEEEVARDIEQRAGLNEVRAALPVVPLDTLKPLVRRASLMLTLDSGPRHIAVAFDVPHIVLMGPTHPDYTSRNLVHAKILRHDVDCGPCHLPVCPLDHRCMQLITVAEVVAAAGRALE